MANEEFIQKLHKGFNFPLDTLRDYIKANTGLDVSGFTKITKGYDSEVYDIGRHMVKIRREGEVAYCCIEWAVEKCKEQNVKVPNIIHRGKIAEGDTLLDILIEEKIPGYPLTPNLYKEAGAQLKKIHSIKVDGFWRRRENGKFDFATYKDIALSATCNRLSEMPLIRAGNVFDDRHVECMKNALYQAEKLNVTPVLCHGDYAPKHILCETSINGIIDFGEFSGGSGYVDLAYFSLNSDWNYFDEFLEGYGKINKHELAINQVMLLMGYLAHSRKIGDEEDAKRLEQKLLYICQRPPAGLGM